MQHAMFSQGSHSVETPTPSPPNYVSRPVFSRILPNDDNEEEEHEGHHDTVQKDGGLFIQKCIPSSHNVAATHLPSRSHVATPSTRQASQASHDQEDLVSRDVILYHLVRSDPVAKAMVISTNQDTIVGGEVLGLQYYEVLVNVVLKREAELARGYDGMQTMGDAHHMSIAWPSNRIKPCSKSRLSSLHNSGTNGRK
ncbi:uncharacterized protein LOC125548452 [Triticum urartu]|uniref:uncharacterized protein LOC125532182 n=1 Tax=Triticum urartu TaxID=4572 RepID=UPI002044B812|nr:uncharacterized protein LOC125532182 [Triticum urartu]XP_048567999.1 uncharacterized protein LOC125548452 [Triticum urartu]